MARVQRQAAPAAPGEARGLLTGGPDPVHCARLKKIIIRGTKMAA